MCEREREREGGGGGSEALPRDSGSMLLGTDLMFTCKCS